MVLNLFRNYLGSVQRRIRSSRATRQRSPYAGTFTPAADHRLLEVLEDRTLLSAQFLGGSAELQMNGNYVVTVEYTTLDDMNNPAALGATGIGFNVHYDSSLLTFVSVANVFPDDLLSSPTDGLEGAAGAEVDADANTDMAINTLYLDFAGTFPNSPLATPITLYEVTFSVDDGVLPSATQINFTRNGGATNLTDSEPFDFQSQSVTLTPPPSVSIAATTNGVEGASPTNGLFTVTQSTASGTDTDVA